MTRRLRLAFAIGWLAPVLLPGLSCSSNRRAPDEPVPTHEEPHHRPVYQNAFVRVLDIEVPAGTVTRYHVHANPMVSVTVRDARSWAQAPGAERGPVTDARAVPYVGDNWDQPMPYTHRVGNADTVAFRRIAAEWLAPAGRGCPALAPMPGYHLVRDTRYGRVYEVRLRPSEATLPHEHACPGLTVVGSGSLRADGTAPAASAGTGAGSWSWRDAAHQHVVRNDGATTLVFYEVDWR